MRAVNQAGPSIEATSAAFGKIEELAPPEGAYRLALIIEYWKPNALRPVPLEATAFATRSSEQTAIGLCVWEGNTEEDMSTGREICHALTDAVANLQTDIESSKYRSYGNLGKCLLDALLRLSV